MCDMCETLASNGELEFKKHIWVNFICRLGWKIIFWRFQGGRSKWVRCAKFWAYAPTLLPRRVFQSFSSCGRGGEREKRESLLTTYLNLWYHFIYAFKCFLPKGHQHQNAVLGSGCLITPPPLFKKIGDLYNRLTKWLSWEYLLSLNIKICISAL